MANAPTHPGAVLREDVLPALGISISQAARDLGISRQMLHRILAEEAAVTPALALRIGKLCGNGPDLWANMQTTCDLWLKKKEMEENLRDIPTYVAV